MIVFPRMVGDVWATFIFLHVSFCSLLLVLKALPACLSNIAPRAIRTVNLIKYVRLIFWWWLVTWSLVEGNICSSVPLVNMHAQLNENERIFSYVNKDSLIFYMSRLQLNMHISKHSYCLANGYKLNKIKNYTEVLYSLWDVLFGFRYTHTFWHSLLNSEYSDANCTFHPCLYGNIKCKYTLIIPLCLSTVVTMDELHETAIAPQFLSVALNLLFSVYLCVLSGNIE
jgi:hypothetical protein